MSNGRHEQVEGIKTAVDPFYGAALENKGSINEI
jgi:hypothetical protein